jgi:hypothetical protein
MTGKQASYILTYFTFLPSLSFVAVERNTLPPQKANTPQIDAISINYMLKKRIMTAF